MEGKDELCFVDSNIWLYALLSSDKPEDQEKSRIANKIVINTKIIISTQVINEVSVNLLRKSQIDEERLARLVQGFYQKYEVVTLDCRILVNASQLRQRYNLSFWDSLLIASALLSSTRYFYSEDMQHNLTIYDKLTIINPFV